MKRIISMLLCILLVITCLAGCTTGEKEKEVGQGVELKIWHDGNEAIMKIIEDNVNKTLSNDKISIKFEKRSGMNDQIQLYGNDPVNGPDMYLWAHDSIGTFATMGFLAPLSDICDESELLKNALPMTKDAGKYNGKNYQLPLFFESLVLIYNKALWEGDVPNTTEDLYNYMVKHTDSSAGTYGMLNQHTNAYNVSPFIYGFGGYIINESAEPGFNDSKTIEAINYNKKFGELQADGDYNTVTTLFNEGKAHAIIGGPWLIDGVKAAGIDYGVKSLSEISLPNGNKLAPFSGVQGICVLKYAVEENKDAIAKVLEAMFTPEIGIALAKEAGCAPAQKDSYNDPEVEKNEMIIAIQKTAETAVPMPNIPEMTSMWSIAEQYMVSVNVNGVDVNEAAEDAQKKAIQAIADMQ